MKYKIKKGDNTYNTLQAPPTFIYFINFRQKEERKKMKKMILETKEREKNKEEEKIRKQRRI